MIKSLQPRLFSFDAEWVPDPGAAQALYNIPHDPPHSLADAFNRLWAEGGANAENPRPYLKTIVCRVVSIAGIFREQSGGGVDLKLVSLPTDPDDAAKSTERQILTLFLKAVGSKKPQLVGYNSINADLPIIVQRAVVHGLSGFGFGDRPDKPWEGMDYFSTAGDAHVDLAFLLGRGSNTPRLHEAATLSAIPGKVDTAGDQVWSLYLQGNLQAIVDYNEFDAFTTHLLWARMAHFSGLLNAAAYAREQELVEALLIRESEGGKAHLKRYLAEWQRLRTWHSEHYGEA